MQRPLLIFSQSDCLIQVVDTNSNTEWQTVQIQILQKPTDLDLHCFQSQGISGFSRTRVNFEQKVSYLKAMWVELLKVSEQRTRDISCFFFTQNAVRFFFLFSHKNASVMGTYYICPHAMFHGEIRRISVWIPHSSRALLSIFCAIKWINFTLYLFIVLFKPWHSSLILYFYVLLKWHTKISHSYDLHRTVMAPRSVQAPKL